MFVSAVAIAALRAAKSPAAAAAVLSAFNASSAFFNRSPTSRLPLASVRTLYPCAVML